MPDIESLKRQIETVKREIANRQAVIDCIEKFADDDHKPKLIGMMNRNPSIDELNEVLATLERMMPPF